MFNKRLVAMDDYDEVGLYFGDSYIINDKISIQQPKIGDILRYRKQDNDIPNELCGERGYFNMVSKLTCIPSDMKWLLWESGIDYSKFEDFKLFIMMVKNLTPKDTSILFGDLNFSDFKIGEHTETKELFLVNPITECVIDELIYYKIVGYLRKIHGFTPKEENPASKEVRDILIREDKEKRERHIDDNYKSSFLPLISALVCSADFKYKKKNYMTLN